MFGFCLPSHFIDEETKLPDYYGAEYFMLKDLDIEEYWRGTRFTDVRGNAKCMPPFTIYMASLHWGLLMVTGTAEPVMANHASATREQVVFMVVNLAAQMLWARVLATITAVMLTSNPGTVHFHQNMDALNRFMDEHSSRIKYDTKMRLREYFHRSRHILTAATNTELLRMLSPALQGELAWKLNKRWLERVNLLQGAETHFLVQVALSLTPMVFAPAELPEAGKMYIIHRGVALYGGRLLTAGKVWGDDMMLTDPEV